VIGPLYGDNSSQENQIYQPQENGPGNPVQKCGTRVFRNSMRKDMQKLYYLGIKLKDHRFLWRNTCSTANLERQG
jgi:hypothetical protein